MRWQQNCYYHCHQSADLHPIFNPLTDPAQDLAPCFRTIRPHHHQTSSPSYRMDRMPADADSTVHRMRPHRALTCSQHCSHDRAPHGPVRWPDAVLTPCITTAMVRRYPRRDRSQRRDYDPVDSTVRSTAYRVRTGLASRIMQTEDRPSHGRTEAE
jgi:hypothetical protein